MDEVKRCNGCLIEKPLTAFYSDKSRPDGRHSLCAACCRERNNARYAANPEAYAARQRGYHAAIVADPVRHKEFLYRRKLRECL